MIPKRPGPSRTLNHLLRLGHPEYSEGSAPVLQLLERPEQLQCRRVVDLTENCTARLYLEVYGTY